MPLRHAAHAVYAVYDCQYHLVWTPKYRKAVLDGEKGERMEALLREIAHAYEVEIVEIAVASDHVHILCSFALRLLHACSTLVNQSDSQSVQKPVGPCLVPRVSATAPHVVGR